VPEADTGLVGGLQPVSEIQRSSRDVEQLRRGLETWLRARLPADASPLVPELTATSANGMSSDTVLFRALWSEGGATRTERLVGRIAPDPADVPVFPSYDLERQFEVMRRVGQLTSVPVPKVWWVEPDPQAIGAPFFVMERVDGEVPPDIMPYNFGDNWLYDAAPEQQRRLQDATVAVLAELHSIEHAEEAFGFLAFPDPGTTCLRRHVAHAQAWYEFAAAGGLRSPLIEAGFAWLEDHWPTDEGPTVVSWGDSRIGNVMYRDFRPVAVLDWEMAGLGPRELDVGWLVYSHRCFEDIAAGYGLPGMPTFLREDDVASTYESLTGYAVRDLDFYTTYAAVQYGVVGLRTGRRSVHFGERPMPDDVDDLLLNRSRLEAILSPRSAR